MIWSHRRKSRLYVERLESRQLLSLSPQFADGLATLTTAPTSVATDSSGNTYIAGNFDTSAATPFAYKGSDGRVADGYIAKLNSAGQEVWVKHTSYLSDIKLVYDPFNDHIYAYGYSAQTMAEVLNPNADSSGVPINLNNDGNAIAQVIMFSSGGQYYWSEILQGDSVYPGSIAVDAQGNLELSGTVSGGELAYQSVSNQTPLTTIIPSSALTDSSYAFAVKLDSGGDEDWAMGVPDNSSDNFSTTLAVDSSNNVYMTDTTSSPVTIKGTTISSSGTFLVKLNAFGTPLWAQPVASGTNLPGHEVAVDGSGNIDVAGSFQGTASFGPASAPTALTAGGAGANAYITQFDATGKLLWARNYGGTGTARTSALVSDGGSNLYLAGSYQGSINLGGFNLTAPSTGGTDLFVAQVDSAGKITLAQNSGGSSGSGYSAPALSTNTKDQISLAAIYSGPSSPVPTFGGVALSAPASSGSALVARVILQAGTAISLQASTLQALAGSPITFTATVAVVAPLQGTPGGTVQFLVDGKNLGSPVALVGGTATTGPITTLGTGSHQVVAVYSGLALYQGSSSSPLSATIVSPTTGNGGGSGGGNGGTTSSGGGGSSQPVPTVAASSAVFVKKKKKITGLQVTFNGALDQASAQAPTNYALAIAVKKGHGAKAKTQLVPVPLGVATYNTSAHTVVFTITRKLKPGSYQLKISSSAAAGVHDTAGEPLLGGDATFALRA